MHPHDTDRLTFRIVTANDAAALTTLNNAPGVMRFLDRTAPSFEHVQHKTIPERQRMAVEHPGYGLWLAYLRETGEFVGRFGLRPNHPIEGDAELGYRLMPEYWGNGLATEGSREMLRYAFEMLRADRVVATTMAANVRSRSVMERIGLRYLRTYHLEFDHPLPGTELGEVEYALTRIEWLTLRRS